MMQDADPVPAPLRTVHDHYESFLAEQYSWMAGGFDRNLRGNREFFAHHGIVPASTGIAIDLGAGCGFCSLPLAEAGFQVTAIDRSKTLLAELAGRRGDLPVSTLCTDILAFPDYCGRTPELIVCMGDTLTHLPGMDAARDLVGNCYEELVRGGRLVLSFRDYATEPAGTVTVIPVRREPGRIFICRLAYGESVVTVTDILYSYESGRWQRRSGSYTKIRPGPVEVRAMLMDAGFATEFFENRNGMVTIIAEKP